MACEPLEKGDFTYVLDVHGGDEVAEVSTAAFTAAMPLGPVF